MKTKMVSLDWVLNQLAGLRFEGTGEAYDFIKESVVAYETQNPGLFYNKDYGADRLCTCGHPYYRHFDSYDDQAPVGCKYCPTYVSESETVHDTCPNGFTQAPEGKTSEELEAEALQQSEVIECT